MKGNNNIVSDRIENIKDILIHVHPHICIERAQIVTESYKKTESSPIILRRARAISEVLKNMTIFIDDYDLIVGNQSSKLRSAPIFPEYSYDWMLEEIDSFENRPSDRFIINDCDKVELKKLLEYWKGKTVKDQVETLQPESVKKATSIGVIEWEGNVTSGEGHLTVDYPMALKYGIGGLLEKTKSLKDELDLSDPESIKKNVFYSAVIEVLEATVTFCRGFSKLAQEKADNAKGSRKVELETIGKNCLWVSKNPPRTFWEALQLVWFVQLILQIESNGHSVSLGRMDQYLFNYYLNDIANNRLSDKEVVELICNFYLKLFSINKLRSWAHTQYLSGYPTFQNICVGGQDVFGNDATNILSFLFLESLEKTRLSEPNFYVRYHHGISHDFFMRCIEVMKLGFGMPAIVNDEVIISSLTRRGVSIEDARNYATVGCLEVSVPGKWGYRCNGKSKFNYLKILELALYGGRDLKTEVTLCPSNDKFNTFEALLEVWRQQLKYYTKLHVTADNINSIVMKDLAPNPFCSVFVQDCLTRGKCISEGGAVYDIQSGAQIGVPNVGNSMAAVKKTVFDEKLLTMDELRAVLKDNFLGEKGESIKHYLLNQVPKYGNDIDSVDILTKRLYDDYCYYIETFRNSRYNQGPIGGGWMPSTVTISSNVPAGKVVGATPDGREAGESLVDGVSPMHGTEHFGITALLKSVSKLSTVLVTGGQLLNLRINASSVDKPYIREKFIALLRTFFELNGWHIQLNTVNTETLRDAQLNPKKYRDLTIRVAGYSALFTTLDPSIQDDIITRVEHVL